MTDENCGNCRFWQEFLKGPVVPRGQCRRYPPARGTRGWTAWPEVEADDWCGEHVAAAADPDTHEGAI